MEANSDYNTEVFASSQEPEEKAIGRAPPNGPGSFESIVALGIVASWVCLSFLLILRRILSAKGISIRSYLAERRRRRADAETTYFKRFRKASLSNDARASLRELMFWLDRINTRPVAPTLEQFARESGMPELSKEEDALQGFFVRSTRGDRTERVSGRVVWKTLL